jgi:hypothetical protein
MSIFMQYARKFGVGAIIESKDGGESAANEERLQHHVVPTVLVEVVAGKGIVVSNRLKDRTCICA